MFTNFFFEFKIKPVEGLDVGGVDFEGVAAVFEDAGEFFQPEVAQRLVGVDADLVGAESEASGG